VPRGKIPSVADDHGPLILSSNFRELPPGTPLTRHGTMNERKTVLKIKGVQVNENDVSHPLVAMSETVLEARPLGLDCGPVWVEVTCKHFLAEYGSAAVEEAMAGSPRHWLRGFFERTARVLTANESYILGPEGAAAFAETAEDRRLAEAISAGATMDPETGIIHGFDR
jgi:hypothetical protein